MPRRPRRGTARRSDGGSWDRRDARQAGLVMEDTAGGPRRLIADLGRRQRYLRLPRAVILCAVVLSGAQCGITLFMVAHFAAATKAMALRVSRVALRPGTGRSKMCLKRLYVLTVRGLYIH